MDDYQENGQPPSPNGAKRFSLRRQVVPIWLEDPETGAARGHVLRELTGTQRDEFLNTMSGRMKVGPDGNPVGISDFRGLRSALISRCLFEAELEDDPDTGETRVGKVAERAVSAAVVNGYPSSTQEALYEECQRINGLTKDARAAAKNG